MRHIKKLDPTGIDIDIDKFLSDTEIIAETITTKLNEIIDRVNMISDKIEQDEKR